MNLLPQFRCKCNSQGSQVAVGASPSEFTTYMILAFLYVSSFFVTPSMLIPKMCRSLWIGSKISSPERLTVEELSWCLTYQIPIRIFCVCFLLGIWEGKWKEKMLVAWKILVVSWLLRQILTLSNLGKFVSATILTSYWSLASWLVLSQSPSGFTWLSLTWLTWALLS